MTRIPTLCVVSSALTVLLALSDNGASAETIVTPKVVTPKVSVHPAKPKVTQPTATIDWGDGTRAAGSGKTQLGGIGSNGNKTYRKLPGTNQLNPQPLPP
jgi:hypothetical protein